MTTPVHTTVTDYHQGLASHLLDLIRKTTSAAIASPRKSSATPTAPVTPRQLSNSSLESHSKVSSGVTTAESRKSSVQQNRDEAQEDDLSSGVGIGRRESGDSYEAYQSQQSGESASDRYDLTARPDSHPARFPPLSPLPGNAESIEKGGANKHNAHFAETSASGAQRYAAHSPTSPASSSRHSRSGRARTRHITVPSSQTELLTREAEHRKAWETDGRRVWRNIPQGFELKLEKKPRTGSNESTRALSVSIHSGLSGAGPGTAIRPDEVFVTDIDTRDLDPVSSSNATNQASTVSEASKLDADAEAAATSESSVSLSIAKPTIKRTSTLQRRQARVEAETAAEQEADAQAASVQSQAREVESEDAAEHADHEGNDRASESVPAIGEDEQAAYIRKREMRLRKKEFMLKKRVGAWWQGVTDSGLHDTLSNNAPDIDPHIPSPSRELESSMLRFPPLPATMPDFIGGDSPTLRLPSLQLLEDGRKNRSSSVQLGFDGLATRRESDVDLLIRLTEMSRVSSASGSGRARFPSAPPHSQSHPFSGADIVTGPSVSRHSLRVKDTTPTPTAKTAARAVLGADRFPII